MEVCSCIDSQIEQLPKPLFRLVCHCETCRTYTGAPHYDECTFLLSDCEHISFDNVEFKSYQKGFSPMKRGKCIDCGKLSYSTIRVWPFPAFVMLPSKMLQGSDKPKPFAHLYYQSKTIDVEDRVKKINGHILSQLAIQVNIMKSLFFRRS